MTPRPGALLGRWRRADPAADAQRVAADLDRLGVLVAAGATQPAAWAYLARSATGTTQRLAAEVAAAAGAGQPLEQAFADAEPAWRAAGASVALAAETGAPLGRTLEHAAAGARDAADLHRAVAASVAGPRASARLVLLLPPATAALGWAFGFDVPRVLLGGPGVALLLAGAALLAAAGVWSSRLLRAASVVSWTTGLELELVATGVLAGLPVERARWTARSVTGALRTDLGAGTEVDEAVAFAEDAGLPVVALLEAEADRLRREALVAARVRAETLGVQLLLPLGLLVLPAFLLLGAVPVALAILSTTSVPY